MIDISYIMGFIGVAVGLIIGILIYSEVEAAIDCPPAATNADGNEACTRAKSIAWTVISILTNIYVLCTIRNLWWILQNGIIVNPFKKNTSP